MNHIVDICPLTKFEGQLKLLHKADDDTVIWLESTATTALVKWNENCITPLLRLHVQYIVTGAFYFTMFE